MSSTFRNAVPSTLEGGTMIRTRAHGLDVMWTTYLEGKGNTVYIMETWEPCGNGKFLKDSTYRTVEVVRLAPKNWGVRLYGEVVDEGHEYKGAAQGAAEALVLA